MGKYKQALKEIIFKILRVLISLSCKINYPKLTSFFLLLSLRKSKLIKQSKNGKKNIIVIDKSFGGDDLAAAFKNKASPYQIFIIQRVFIREIYNHFFKKFSNLIHENNYENIKNENIENAKLKYRNYLYKTFFYLNKYKIIDAFISFNIFYLIERELHFAAKELKIKFIVHMKESIHWGQKKRSNFLHWKNNFNSMPITRVSIYNKYTKDIISSSNLVKKDKIEVVGMPRSDDYFNFKIKKDGEYVLFLMIERTASLPYYSGEWNEKYFKKFDWKKLSIKTNKIIIDLAKENKDIFFYFKTKPNESVEELRVAKKNSLNNLKIVQGGASKELIRNAKIIIAFNTTGIFEGLILKKNIIVPKLKLYPKTTYNKY